MQIISHRKHAVNLSRAERIISAVGGGILAAAGLQAGLKKSVPASIAFAAVGGDLLRRAITGHSYMYEALGVRTAPKGQGEETTSVPYELGIRVDESITIDRPRGEVYRFWKDLSNLPKFMRHLESVREIDGNRSHWVVQGPAGRTVEWDAVIHNEEPNERIAWRSLPGADVDNAGSVWFKDAPGNRGTELKIELQYNPPAGALGAVVAGFWGREPSQQIKEDLHRLKQIMEAGEIPTTEGQPTGKEGRQQTARSDRAVQHASEASFPASDAPAYTR